MINQVIFKKGQKVTIRDGWNASDFNMNATWSIMSAYSIKDWFKKEFTIEGTVKLITFTLSTEVYGAYLPQHNGVNVGYIYNSGIKAIEDEA